MLSEPSHKGQGSFSIVNDQKDLLLSQLLLNILPYPYKVIMVINLNNRLWSNSTASRRMLGVAGKVTYDTGLGLMLDWS